MDYAHRAFWSRVHAWAGQLLCIAPATPLDASCPQDPAYDELQPSLPQVEEPNQRTDLDFSQPVVVSDITYIPLANGEVCYLHLITDAYSHKIVGWVLADTLRVSATINALQQAIEQAVEMTGDENLTGLIHHSDRGVQYCCDPYVALLQKHGIAISMTEDYKPTDNAVAERINGIIKAESSHPRGRFNDIGHARNVIARYIHFYNHRRPHMSIGYKIPAVAHLEKGIQKKMWKKKKYPSTSSNKKKDAISLQSRTASPGEGAGQRT